MEENILHKLKEIWKQNEINEANITNNSPSCTQDTSGENRKRKRRDNDSGRHRAETIKEDIKNNIRRRAGEEFNKAYGRHRDQEYKPARQLTLSRIGKKNTYSSKQLQSVQQEMDREVREEEYEEVDEISESDSDDTHNRRDQPRGGQWDTN